MALVTKITIENGASTVCQNIDCTHFRSESRADEEQHNFCQCTTPRVVNICFGSNKKKVTSCDVENVLHPIRGCLSPDNAAKLYMDLWRCGMIFSENAQVLIHRAANEK